MVGGWCEKGEAELFLRLDGHALFTSPRYLAKGTGYILHFTVCSLHFILLVPSNTNGTAYMDWLDNDVDSGT